VTPALLVLVAELAPSALKLEAGNEVRARSLAHVATIARECGVLPTLCDLRDPESRAAWLAAGRAYDVRQAMRIGTAAQGPLGPLRVFAELDGGASHDSAAIVLGAAKLEEEFRAAALREREGARG
jgi:hypothetical protein